MSENPAASGTPAPAPPLKRTSIHLLGFIAMAVGLVAFNVVDAMTPAPAADGARSTLHTMLPYVSQGFRFLFFAGIGLATIGLRQNWMIAKAERDAQNR